MLLDRQRRGQNRPVLKGVLNSHAARFIPLITLVVRGIFVRPRFS